MLFLYRMKLEPLHARTEWLSLVVRIERLGRETLSEFLPPRFTPRDLEDGPKSPIVECVSAIKFGFELTRDLSRANPVFFLIFHSTIMQLKSTRAVYKQRALPSDIIDSQSNRREDPVPFLSPSCISYRISLAKL